MKRIASLLLVVVASTAAVVATAHAQPNPGIAVPAATADVKAGTGVANRESVGTASEFSAGTKVWVWSRVTGAANTVIKHVWKKDGVNVWSTPLKIGSSRWATQSRRQLKAGSYSVEVVAADGSVLGTVAFTVK
jgi:Protein of unknown function (DUF2914)